MTTNDRNKAQQVTSGIKNCRAGRLFKGCSQLQLSCNLIGNHPQSATFHTAIRCGTFEKTSEHRTLR